MQHFQLAIIKEDQCIGCAKCSQVCPYDAILGAPQFLHTVLTTECTGCGLCVAPCPVDCISMITVEQAGFDRQKASTRRVERRKRLAQHGVADQKIELHRLPFAPIPDQTISKDDLSALLKRKQITNKDANC